MSRKFFAGGIALVAGCIVGQSGCHLAVNPYADALAGGAVVSTPSALAVGRAEASATVLQRQHSPTQVSAYGGAVTHGPLYFEDPFEEQGSDDGRFAWTGEEYLHWICGPGRFLMNGVLFPVSAVVTPPWVVMASDGQDSRRVLWMEHDATRWRAEESGD